MPGLSDITHHLEICNALRVGSDEVDLLRKVESFDAISDWWGKIRGNAINSNMNSLRGGTVTTSFGGSDVISKILSFVEPKEFRISFVNKFSKTDKFLHPCEKSKMSQLEWEEIIRRAQEETKIGADSKFPITLLASICAAGYDKAKDNEYFQMMRYYCDTFKGEEPFFEDDQGLIKELKHDSHAATRFLTLLRCANLRSMINFPDRLKDVLREVCIFIFQDPFVNETYIKKNSSVLKQSMFALQPIGRGKMIRWDIDNPKLSKPQLRDFTVNSVTHNDHIYYEFVKPQIEAELQGLQNAGLALLAQLFSDMIKAEPNPENMDLATHLIFIESLCGFMRTEETLSSIEQLAKQPPYDINNLTMAPHLEKEWYDFVSWAAIEKKIPNYADWKRDVPAMLTNRSAGGDKVKVELDIGHSIPGITKPGSSNLSFTFTDKTFNFYAHPYDYLTKSAISRGYTMETPGHISFRDVPGKPTRTIFMKRIEHYLAEGVLGTALLDYQAADLKGTVFYDTSADFTLAKERGVVTLDHSLMIWATSVDDVYVNANDFSQFDSSQRWENMRQFALTGTKRGLLSANIVQPFGDWESVSELMDTIWKQTKDAVFVLNRRKMEKEIFDQIELDPAVKERITLNEEDGLIYAKIDQVLSGEYMTLGLNNLTNRACVKAIVSNLFREANTSIRSSLNLLRMLFMGDDSIQVWDVRDWNLDKYTLFIENLVSTAGQNGLDINKFKSCFRSHYGEYLKKTAIDGYIISRRYQIFECASENPNYLIFPTEKAMSKAGLMNTWIARGADHDWCTRFVHHLWNLQRLVKIGVKRGVKRNQSLWYRLPFAALWTPISLRGSGVSPHTVIGANKDAVIAWECYQDPKLMELINNAATVLDVGASGLKRKIAMELKDGKNTIPKDVFKPGPEYIQKEVMRSERAVRSLQSSARLKEKGLSVGDLEYTNLGNRKILNAIEGSTKLKRVEWMLRLQSGQKYQDNAKLPTKDMIGTRFGWVNSFKVMEHELLLPVKEICPVAGLDPKIELLFKTLGMNTAQDPYLLTPAEIANIIRSDRDFPRDIQPETVMLLLSQPKILYNPSNVYDCMIAMGADPTMASRVVNAMAKSDSMAFKMNAKTFSLADAVIPMLDLTYDSHKRVTKMVDLPDKNVMSLIHEIVFLISITRAMRDGVMKSYTVLFDDNTQPTLLSSLVHNASWYSILKLVNVFNPLYSERESGLVEH